MSHSEGIYNEGRSGRAEYAISSESVSRGETEHALLRCDSKRIRVSGRAKDAIPSDSVAPGEPNGRAYSSHVVGFLWYVRFFRFLRFGRSVEPKYKLNM